MDERQKRVLIAAGIITVLLVVVTGSVLPLIIVAVAAYYFIRQQKGPIIRDAHVVNNVNTNMNTMNNMPNFDAQTFIGKMKKTSGIILLVIIAVIVFANAIVVIPAGQTGVYHVFGKVRDNEISSGIHLINPLASVEHMSVRTEQYTMSIATGEGQRAGDDSIEALTKEGLKVALDITVLYHLVEEQASDVYRELGLGYDEKIIRPEVRSAIREVIALYEAKDIYSEKREEAVRQIEEILAGNLESRGIVTETVLLRNVALPAMLTGAIETKLAAEQEAQRYDFVLQREEKEAERKRIEAAGQRDAQQIINQSLTDRYLQYLYIQNLENREGTIYVPYDLPLFRGL